MAVFQRGYNGIWNLTDQSETIAELRGDVRRLEELVLAVNDAHFCLAGILGRVVVDTGLIDRDALADAIEIRAGSPDNGDHNRLLLTFARAVRMNFPGGSFEVIDGGKPGDG